MIAKDLSYYLDKIDFYCLTTSMINDFPYVQID